MRESVKEASENGRARAAGRRVSAIRRVRVKVRKRVSAIRSVEEQ